MTFSMPHYNFYVQIVDADKQRTMLLQETAELSLCLETIVVVFFWILICDYDQNMNTSYLHWLHSDEAIPCLLSTLSLTFLI